MLPAWTSTANVRVAMPPSPSVTVSTTVKLPGRAYRWVTTGPLPVVLSPNCQMYVSTSLVTLTLLASSSAVAEKPISLLTTVVYWEPRAGERMTGGMLETMTLRNFVS